MQCEQQVGGAGEGVGHAFRYGVEEEKALIAVLGAALRVGVCLEDDGKGVDDGSGGG
jgi:hypothetical protein